MVTQATICAQSRFYGNIFTKIKYTVRTSVDHRMWISTAPSNINDKHSSYHSLLTFCFNTSLYSPCPKPRPRKTTGGRKRVTWSYKNAFIKVKWSDCINSEIKQFLCFQTQAMRSLLDLITFSLGKKKKKQNSSEISFHYFYNKGYSGMGSHTEELSCFIPQLLPHHSLHCSWPQLHRSKVHPMGLNWCNSRVRGSVGHHLCAL